jgi:hypothetical protein
MTALVIFCSVLAVVAGAGWGFALASYSTLRRQDAEMADLRGRLSAYHPYNVRKVPPTAEWGMLPPEGENDRVQYLMDAAGTGLMVEPYE